tara:strand:- start:3194 stop:3754 length:561 start_codon:yes stop_codon:yes gene_type:complete
MSYKIKAGEVINTLEKTLSNNKYSESVKKIAQIIKQIDSINKIVTIFGNGGSAADSQHFAAELICTYEDRERKPFKALALTTDTSIMSAWSNDFSYETVFKRQIEAFKENIGLAIGLSTSGTSKNVTIGLKRAYELGIKTCLICGNNDLNYEYIDIILKIPSKNTATIQTITQITYHSICTELEKS